MRRWLFGVSGLVPFVGCSDKFESCEQSRTCSDGPSAAGGADGTGGGGMSDTCPMGQSFCEGACVDTNASAEHCGECDQACENGEVCMAGSCEFDCAENLLACDGACIDPETNSDFCGASGACTGDEAGEPCAGSEACVEGQCLGNDATLASLEVTPGTLSPEFAAEEPVYVVSVPRFLPVVSVVAEPADEGSTLEIDDEEVDAGAAFDVEVPIEGMVSLSIVVTAPGGASEAYDLTLIGEEATGDYIKASNTGMDDEFGTSVAIEGDTLVVGAPLEDSIDENAGAVYVFVRTDGVWRQQLFLRAPNAGAGDEFGSSVALQGDTLIVGAPGEDGLATGAHDAVVDDGVEPSDNYGAVYVFQGEGATWELQAYVKPFTLFNSAGFGASVALDGDTLVIGGPLEGGDTSGVLDPDDAPPGGQGLTPESGAVHVFVRGDSGWEGKAYIKAPNPGETDRFGFDVAVNGDVLAIGAPYEDGDVAGVRDPNDLEDEDDGANDSGATYLYHRSEGDWALRHYVKAPNAGESDLYGFAVALSDGTLAVGAPQEANGATGIEAELEQLQNGDSDDAPTSGAVYVYSLDGQDWVFDAYVKAENARPKNFFGFSVALDGDSLAVGAQYETSTLTGVHPPGGLSNDGTDRTGAAYVYSRIGGAWRLQALIKPEVLGFEDRFGAAVAFSAGTVAVGAPSEDSDATGVNGDPESDDIDGSGAVYVYR